MTCRIIPAGETNAGLVINRNVKTVIALVEKWPLSSVIVITFPSSDTSLCRIITFMAAQMEKKNNPAKRTHVCQTQRRCKNCRGLLPTCKEYHNLRLYQCYIQNPTELEEKLKRRKKLKRKVNGSQNLETKDPLFV